MLGVGRMSGGQRPHVAVERLLHRILPGRLRRALKGPWRGAQQWLLTGDRVTCPICGGHYRRLLPRHGRPDQQCPGCSSLVRHRALWLYLERVLDIGRRPMRILHVAPEPGISRRILASGADYVAGDIDPMPGFRRIDVTDIAFPDGSFDLVICSHVLEHVPDDRRAIREIDRVLRADGTALIVVPVKDGPTIEFLASDGDPGHAPRSDPAAEGADGPAAHRRVGDHGHVRQVGTDYVDRLRDANLEVEVVDYATTLSSAERDRFAIEPGEPIFVCHHRAGRDTRREAALATAAEHSPAG